MRMTAILVLASSICAIGAASAAASDFRVTLVESDLHLKGKQVSGAAGEQKFLVEASHEVVCKKATVSGQVVALEANAVGDKVTYGECTAFGLVAVTVPELEYEVDAEGRLAIVKEALIKVETVKCTVTIKPQTELLTVSYSPSEKLTKKLEVAVKVTNVETEVSGGGGTCGKEGKDTGGKFTGTDEVEVEGAEVETLAKTLAPGDCVQVATRQGNYEDAGCTIEEVKGNYGKILCRNLGIGHLRPFSDNACTMRSVAGTWYETVCLEVLPATHKWANNVCTQMAMGNGAWELYKT
jgi:hypothetical protein